MQITDLGQIHDSYDHVYLSPHLDDAALSCGGAIIGRRVAGERVLVITLCTAAPAPEGPFNDLALEFHQQWGLSPEAVVAARLSEETLAMERLDADYYWAGMADAIYRYPQVYTTRGALFGAPAPDDPLLPALRRFISTLRDDLPDATLYAPLGVGNHVDHQITYRATLDSARSKVAFYEDVPYVTKPGALDQRLDAVAERFTPSLIDISAALAQKIDAVNAYVSQLGELFGGAEAMARSVAGYARGLQPNGRTYCERLWLVRGA